MKISHKKIVRTESAGVFYANVTAWDPETRTALLTDSRRVWYWSGAASLSELANKGPANPDKCKFPGPVNQTVTGIIEIIEVTAAAASVLDSVREWTAHE